MDLTQNQIDVLSQNLRRKRIRIELLNYELRTIDSIEGNVISGSITANAENDIRRSGQIQLAIPINLQGTTFFEKLDGFVIESGGKIWLDKYVKIFIGINDSLSKNDDIVWYKMGVFLINQPVKTFSSNEFTISFECIDLMAKLTGKRQGQLTGQTTIIEKGYYKKENGETIYIKTQLKDILVSTITDLGGFSKYSIYPIPDVYKYLPYDIKLGVGSTVYDILRELMDILSTWQIYFDLDGILTIEPIPSGEQAILYNVDIKQYITDSVSVNFENVKNQVVVYGRCNSLTYYTENLAGITNVEYSNNTLILKYDKINSDNLIIGSTSFGFLTPNQTNSTALTNVSIYSEGDLLFTASLVKYQNSRNSFGAIYNSTQIEENTFIPNEIYYLRIYDANIILNDDGFDVVDITQPIVIESMGKQSTSYSLVNDNKESPFYINNNLGNINFYAGMATIEGGVNWGNEYNLILNNDEIITDLQNGTIITFMANYTNNQGVVCNIKNFNGTTILNNIPIVQNIWVNNTRPGIFENKLTNDYTIWQLRYEIIGNNRWLVLLGRNPNAISKIFSGGEYDNINSDQLAYERCLWELFNTSNTNDSISLSIVPNYLLDVNVRIPYHENNALPRNLINNGNEDDDTIYYITKQITYPLGIDSTPQSVNAIRIYDSGNLVGQDYK